MFKAATRYNHICIVVFEGSFAVTTDNIDVGSFGLVYSDIFELWFEHGAEITINRVGTKVDDDRVLGECLCVIIYELLSMFHGSRVHDIVFGQDI